MKNEEEEGYKPSPGRNGERNEMEKIENRRVCTYRDFSLIVVNL